MSGIDLLQRASDAQARLLRAERCGDGLALTFDVGRITIEAGPSGTLIVEHPESREEIAGAMVSLDEEEPWWRVLGAPLTDVRWQEPDAERQLSLRFREADDGARVVTVEWNGRAVTARLVSG